MSTWVNFKELRTKLKYEDVLRHYKVEVKRKGNQHHGCPCRTTTGKEIHRHSRRISRSVPNAVNTPRSHP
jgi:hypothetical protein